MGQYKIIVALALSASMLVLQNAIVEPFIVDGSKCISYLTIELKDAIPNEFKNNMDNWAFGCDVCQDVCPWNRFSMPHQRNSISITKLGLLNFSTDEWYELTEETFNTIFKQSAVKRTKYKGLQRNLEFIKPL
jgi:epoxyqueuosine reductase